MKYYIPSSNINLDNILQSECILPPMHYSQRLSGYKSFEKIEELRSFSSIVLFDYPINFTINDPGRYNYPILIEIEDEYQCHDFEKLNDGIYVCNHAIQITPSNCRIYFFSKQAYDLTLINTESNKSIKYYRKYTILPSTFGLKLFPLPKLDTSSCTPLPCEDKYIDKQKGAMYAYLLGQKLSLSADLASLLRLDQEIYNILTSLIATPSASSAFTNKLSKLIEDYKNVDSIEKGNQIVFNDELDSVLGNRFKFLKGCFIDALKKLGLWDICFDALCKKWNCRLLPDVNTLVSSSDFAMLRAEIERRTNNSITKHQSNIKESLLGISVNGYNVVIENMPLVNMAIEYIISNDLTPESLSAHRRDVYMGIMTPIVSLIKTNIGENNWAGSPEHVYVNTLYAHIGDPGVPFNINDINNDELKAIACFILRGHSFSDLAALLKINAIEDYRASFVLWGTLCGYYGMNRDSLELVLSDENYERVYKTLFGKELGKITNIQLRVTPQPPTEDEKFNIDEYKFLLEKFKFEKDIDKFVDSCINRSKSTSTEIADAIDYICNSKPYKGAKKQCKLAKNAYKAYLLKDNKVGLCEFVKNIGLTKKAQEGILEHYGFAENKPGKKAKSSKTKTEADLFTFMDKQNVVGNEEINCLPTEKVREETTNVPSISSISHTGHYSSEESAVNASILKDRFLVSFISSLDYLSDYQKKKIEQAIENVIKMHLPSGSQSHETRNEQIISHLRRYCLATSLKTGDYFCLRKDTPADVEAVNKVCEDLINRYADR